MGQSFVLKRKIPVQLNYFVTLFCVSGNQRGEWSGLNFFELMEFIPAHIPGLEVNFLKVALIRLCLLL